MRYYVTWKDSAFRTTREEYVEYNGFQAELAQKLGQDILDEIASRQEMDGKELTLTLTERAGVVHGIPEGVIATVVVDRYNGETMQRILDGLLG